MTNESVVTELRKLLGQMQSWAAIFAATFFIYLYVRGLRALRCNIKAREARERLAAMGNDDGIIRLTGIRIHKESAIKEPPNVGSD